MRHPNSQENTTGSLLNLLIITKTVGNPLFRGFLVRILGALPSTERPAERFRCAAMKNLFDFTYRDVIEPGGYR